MWRAWDHRRRRYVAAKVLQQRNAHTLLRFVREQALRIDHPHVLAPASWAADDDQVLFTMDLVTGGSLAHVIGDYGALPPRFCCTLLDQLLSGLAAVHAEGVVHRDIKPANILLEATGTGRPHLRLSDFGISMRKGEPRLTATDYVVGTPGYVAPEQVLGAEPDFPADLFAVGLVALYLIQGSKPDAKALIEHFAAHGTPRAPQGVPESLWQVVATLLRPDPQARFRTATGARKALASAVELLPEPGTDDEGIEIFDQLGPLPEGFGPDGPLAPAPQPPPPQLPPPQPPPLRPSPPQPPAASPVGAPPSVASPGAAGPHSAGPGSAGPHSVGPGAVGPGAVGPGTAASPSSTSPLGDHPVSAHGSHTGTPLPARPPTPPPTPPSGLPPCPPPSSPPPPHPPMSETGSFHLPPPLPPPPQPASPPTPMPGPVPQAVYASAPVSPSGARPEPVADPSAPSAGPTGWVGVPAVGLQPQATQPPQSSQAPQAARPPRPRAPRSHAARPRHTGPPVRVALPMLLAALACFAVGFWALARI